MSTAIQSLDADDEDDTLVRDLLEIHADFRALVAKSAASARKPFAPKNRGANQGSLLPRSAAARVSRARKDVGSSNAVVYGVYCTWRGHILGVAGCRS